METIAITNQKGGIGKTSTAAAIAEGLRLSGYKVLIVDLDPQGNLTYSSRAENDKTALDLLAGSCPAADTITTAGACDIIPSEPRLSAAGYGEILTGTGSESILAKALEGIRAKYDFCIIDTPPALGILTVNALMAADGVIIPTVCDGYSLQGIGQLSRTIEAVREKNSRLRIYGIVLTRYNKRTAITRKLSNMIEGTALTVGTKVYKTHIRECVAVKEAQVIRKSLYDYAPKSNAAADYRELVNEILKDQGRRRRHGKKS